VIVIVTLIFFMIARVTSKGAGRAESRPGTMLR